MGRPRKVVDDGGSVAVLDREPDITAVEDDNGVLSEEGIDSADNTESVADGAETVEVVYDVPQHSDLIERIGAIQTPLNELDEYLESISSLQSQNDEYLSDLLHFIESEDIEFTPRMALKFVKLLKEKRERRRTLNNDWEIKRVYDTGRQRLGYANQRDMFMASIYKKEKELSSAYRYRQTNADEIKALIK